MTVIERNPPKIKICVIYSKRVYIYIYFFFFFLLEAELNLFKAYNMREIFKIDFSSGL